MRGIAVYTRGGTRLLTLKEAQQQGYGSVLTLKKRLRLGKIKGYKVGNLWAVPKTELGRRVRCGEPLRRGAKRKTPELFWSVQCMFTIFGIRDQRYV